MVKMHAHRFALGFFLLAAGFVLFGPGMASAHPHPERVRIISGAETSASTQIKRTEYRVRRVNGRLIVTTRTTNLSGASELRGGPGSGNTAPRASTGRSPETVSNGVRIINKRGG